MLWSSGKTEGFGSARGSSPCGGPCPSGVVSVSQDKAGPGEILLASGQLVGFLGGYTSGSRIPGARLVVNGDLPKTGWVTLANGRISAFGGAKPFEQNLALDGSKVGRFSDLVGFGDTGAWAVASNGEVFELGQAPYFGSPHPRVLMAGDSIAFTLGADLEMAMPKGVKMDDQGILGCGIAQGEPIMDNGYFYPKVVAPCSGAKGATPWEALYARDVSSFFPSVVTLLVGYWESVWRVVDGRWQHIGQPEYDAYLASQLQKAIEILSHAGAHIDILTTPYVSQGPPGDATIPGGPPPKATIVTNEDINRWNQLARTTAAIYGSRVSFLNLNAKVDPGGHFASRLSGIVLRAPDGVHFPFFDMHDPSRADPDTEAECRAFAQ